MSANVPEVLDVWRMAAARRQFEGVLPLARLQRLAGSLLDTEGEVRYALEFGRGDGTLKVPPYVELSIDAGLPLQCQRSLQRFVLPVKLVQLLGLIRSEAEEASLPPGYEPLLVPEDGMVRPADLVEDELVLAVPLVPVAPDSAPVEQQWPAEVEEEVTPSPFAALAALKKER